MLTSTFLGLVIEEVEAAPDLWGKHEAPTEGLCLSRMICLAHNKLNSGLAMEDDVALVNSACLAVAETINGGPLPDLTDPHAVSNMLVYFNDNIAQSSSDVVALLRKAQAAEVA